jgi:hypothetical protein
MKKHYVNNKDFYEAITAYQAVLIKTPNARIPNYIGECIMKICGRLSTNRNFIGYSFRDEMVADGIENCIYAVPLFNPEKTNNPFAYFTQIAWNAFLRRIAKEKKEQYIKHKNMQNSFLDSAGDDMSYGDSGGQIHVRNNDISNEIIGSFENKLTKGKKSVKVGIEKFATEDKVV